jgi:hypothetical protein
MSDFVGVNSRIRCPVCGGKKSCSISKTSGDVFCHSYIDGDGTNPGYRFLKIAPSGLWGIHREGVNGNNVAQKREFIPKEKAKKNGKLSNEELDRKFRSWLGEKPLSPLHRNNLKRRGLNDIQISNGRFSSLDYGFAIPCWSVENEILGAQIRLDNSDGGRYRWLKDSHLKNGELPLTFALPPTPSYIGLIEGILKPWICSQLDKNTAFIGAAGGMFPQSQEQLKEGLARLSKRLGTDIVYFYADAGAKKTRIVKGKEVPGHVHQRDSKTIRLIESWGYQVFVVDWGQLDDKEQPDYDELLASGATFQPNYIPAEEYVAPLEPADDHQISAEEWEGRNFSGWLSNLLAKLLKREEKQKRRRFDPTPITTITPPTIIKYTPGELPNYEEWLFLKSPEISFQEGQRLELIAEMVAKGFKHILDASGTGTGKSTSAGMATPEQLGARRLWYFANNHRNPSTPEVQANYTDLPVRNNGMVRDFNHLTPLGKPWIVWPKPGETPDIAGNCHRTPIFRALASKNIDVEGSESPVCQSCHLLNECKFASGPGYGFKFERREALRANRIRANHDSAPLPHEFDFSKDIAFHEEAGSQIKPVSILDIYPSDVDALIAHLATHYPNLYSDLKPWLDTVKMLLMAPMPKYGLTHPAIVKSFPEIEREKIEQWIEQLTYAQKPDLSFLETDEVEAGDGLSEKEARKLNRLLKKYEGLSNREGSEQIGAGVLKNWLPQLLRALAYGALKGILAASYGHLSITLINHRQRELFKSMRANVFMDATLNRAYLVSLINDGHMVVTIRQEQPKPENLTVIQVQGMGLLGKIRSAHLNCRVDALKNKLIETFEGAAVIDFKAHGDLAWFVDSRGSNDFQQVQTLIAVGTPFQNLGALAAQFGALTGTSVDLENPSPEFQKFVEDKTNAEITQCVGRLRHQLRPDEQLRFVFVSDYPLDFLGVPVQKVEAFAVTPEAGTRAQQTKHALAQVFEQAKSQKEIAAGAGVTQGRVSQIAQEFGGWQKFKQVLGLVADRIAGKHPQGEVSSDLIWLAREFLPLEQNCLDAIKEMMVTQSWGDFTKIVGHLDLSFAAKIVSQILAFAPSLELAQVESG